MKHAISQSDCCKRVASAVVRDLFFNPAGFHHFLQFLAHRPVVLGRAKRPEVERILPNTSFSSCRCLYRSIICKGTSISFTWKGIFVLYLLPIIHLSPLTSTILSVVSSFTSMNERAVKETKTKMSRTKASSASSNLWIMTCFSSSSVRYSRSFTLRGRWNWANGLRGICPFWCALITTPFTHITVVQMEP